MSGLTSTPQSSQDAINAVARNVNHSEGFKIREPEPFKGDPNQLDSFLLHLKVYYRLNPERFADTQHKVLYAGMLLRDGAAQWFRPFLVDYLDDETNNDQETITIFNSFTAFEEKIRRVYRTVDQEQLAARQIQTLKQTGSVTDYWRKFQQLATHLEWDEEALRDVFYRGLKNDIKIRFMPSAPKEYEKLVDAAIQIDDRLYEIKQESGDRGIYHPRYKSNMKKARYPQKDNRWDPMDLDMTHGREPSRGNSRRTQKPYPKKDNKPRLDVKEQERRKKDNLCFSCGKAGHRSRDCQSKGQQLHMTILPTEAKKADTSGTLTGEDGLPDNTTQVTLVTELKEEQINTHVQLGWTDCYEDNCLIHLSDKLGSGWFPQKKKQRKDKSRAKTQTLAMANPRFDLPIIQATGERVTVRTIHYDWDDDECTRPSCEVERDGHYHRIFEINKAHEKPEHVDLWLCLDDECYHQEFEYVHAHPRGRLVYVPTKRYYEALKRPTQSLSMTYSEEGSVPDSESDRAEEIRELKDWANSYDPDEEGSTTSEVATGTRESDIKEQVSYLQRRTTRQKQRIAWLEERVDELGSKFREEQWIVRKLIREKQVKTQSLSMTSTEETPERLVIEDRGDRDLLSQVYECSDEECAFHGAEHGHRRNCDPKEPRWVLSSRFVLRILKTNGKCDDDQCKYEKTPHLHMPKNW